MFPLWNIPGYLLYATPPGLVSGDRGTACKKLRHDILQSVHHVFGRHQNCSDFCCARTDVDNSAGTGANDSPTSQEKSTDNADSSDSFGDAFLFDQQVSFWTEGYSIGYLLRSYPDSRPDSAYNLHSYI